MIHLLEQKIDDSFIAIRGDCQQTFFIILSPCDANIYRNYECIPYDCIKRSWTQEALRDKTWPKT